MTADEIRLYRYLGYRPLATLRATARTAPPLDDIPPLDLQGIEAAPVLFLETQARFPAYTKVRQDRGNNGYCELQLAADGSVVSHYIDWMGKSRCVASLSPFPPGSVPTSTVKPFA